MSLNWWGGRERQQVDRAALLLVRCHCLLNLQPPPLGNLAGADRAGPDAAAGLQPGVVGCLVFLGLPDLDVPHLLTQYEALVRPAFGQESTGYGLQREPLHPAFHGVNDPQNLAGFRVNPGRVFIFRISTKGGSAAGYFRACAVTVLGGTYELKLDRAPIPMPLQAPWGTCTLCISVGLY